MREGAYYAFGSLPPTSVSTLNDTEFPRSKTPSFIRCASSCCYPEETVSVPGRPCLNSSGYAYTRILGIPSGAKKEIIVGELRELRGIP